MIMVNKYPKVTFVGIVALSFSILCIVFKCNPYLNVTMRWMRVFGDFLLNIAVSIIAAVIFFVFQVVLLIPFDDAA